MSRAVLVLVLGAAVAVASDDEDPVAKRLDASKAAYEKERERVVKGVAAWFDKQEDAARKAGNKKLVDQLRDERKRFDERGDVPPAAPKALVAQLDAARKAREAVLQQAIKEYTRARLDGPAGLVEEELRQFRYTAHPLGRYLGDSPARIVNRHSGKIVAVADGSKADGAPLIQFDWTDGADQRWAPVPAADDFFYLRNENSKTYMGAPPNDDKAVVLAKAATGEAARRQQWKLVPVKSESDHYLIQNRASGRLLSVDFGSKDNAARVIQFRQNGAAGSADQHWKFEKVEK